MHKKELRKKKKFEDPIVVFPKKVDSKLKLSYEKSDFENVDNVIFDFEETISLDGDGIWEIIKLIKMIPTSSKIYYKNCRQEIIGLVNFRNDFFPENAKVESVYIPYSRGKKVIYKLYDLTDTHQVDIVPTVWDENDRKYDLAVFESDYLSFYYRRNPVRFSFFDNFMDGVFVFNQTKDIVYCNLYAARVFAYDSPKDVLNKKCYDCFNFENDDLYFTDHGENGHKLVSKYYQTTYKTKSGGQGNVRIMVTPEYPKNSNNVFWVAYFQNIDPSDKKINLIAKEDLEKLNADVNLDLLKDKLTGLGNYDYFLYEFKFYLKKLKSDDEMIPLALIMVDVDDFSKVNEIYGKKRGDEALKVITYCINDSIRRKDIPARYQGEEFAIILPEVKDLKALTGISQRIRSKIENRKITKSDETNGILKLTASIGGVLIVAEDLKNWDEEDCTPFIKCAETNLHMAKEAGKNKIITSSVILDSL